MFVLKSLELVLELVVPRVQDKDLERQRGRGDREVNEGDSTSNERHFQVFKIFTSTFLKTNFQS